MRHLLLTAALLTLAPAAFAGGAGPRPAPRPTPAPVAPAPKPVTPAAPKPAPAPAPKPAVTQPAAPAAPVFPDDLLFQPGQSWLLEGTTAGGEDIEREMMIDEETPEWDDGWDFTTDLGPLSYDVETGLVFVADMMTGLTDGTDMQVCIGYADEEEGVMDGVLLSGDMDGISEQLGQLDDSEGFPETNDDLRAAFEDAGVDVGTCNLSPLD